MFIWYVLLVIFGLFLSTEYYAFKTGAPTIASLPSARRQIVTALQQHLAAPDGAGLTLIDLGSGNGQLATRLARALPQARIIGLELSVVPWLLACLRQKLTGPANLVFRRVDFWSYDATTADIVVMFLTENIMPRVSRKLRAELKPGALVIANDTPLTGWEPIDTLATGLFGMKVYVYRQTERAAASQT